MIHLGEMQSLVVVKTTDFGVYLSTSSENEKDKVLLPRKEVPAGTKVGYHMEVFLYKDSEDRPIATTTQPPISLGGIALLKVKEVATIGAFLDWGLAKDLLLPFKEQTRELQAGDDVLVTLYIDKSKRLCASMKIYDYLQLDSEYQKDDKVTGVVYEIIPEFGAFVAVDNKYSGLIPKKELFDHIKAGQQIEARVMSVKPDGKLDLSLREKAYVQMDNDASAIYNALTNAGGFLPYNDKSDPEKIKEVFHMSKNAYKRAIGRLLKEGKLEFKNNGISLK
ncbi:S1 RNA binding domain [Lachnospiraceae bacterium KM106-2]|nr:S1 RNA binding domain [Lachnospiraceae bacterium KM106-2]